MAIRSKAVQAWIDGRERAQSTALTTLSGLPLDDDRHHFGSMFRVYQTAAIIWERLYSRELRTEEEVKDAAQKIGMLLEKDRQESMADGGRPMEFNAFEKRGEDTRLNSELEWILDVWIGDDTEFEEIKSGNSLEALAGLGLEGWQSWEIIYVAALRTIDSSVKALTAGDLELGMCLVFDALRQTYLCDIVAKGRERNQDYLFTKTDRIYEQKILEFKVRDKVNAEVGEAVKQDRTQLAKAAAIKRNEGNRNMRAFVIEKWNVEKVSYGENKSDFARHYSRLLLQEHAFPVEASTIATRWLRGL